MKMPENAAILAAGGDDDINLLELARILWSERRTIVVTTVVVAAITITVSFMMTPVYRAEAVVIEVDSSHRGGDTAAALLGQFAGLASLANVDLYTPSTARTTLQSRSLAEEFISRNNLLPLLFEDEWDDKARMWKVDLEAPPSLPEGALEFMEEAFQVATNAEAGTINVIVEWSDPQLAARWANGIVTLANEMLRDRDIAEAQRNIGYLNKQISETSVVELQRVLYGLLQTEQKTVMLANSRDEYSFKVIDPAIAPIEAVRPARLVMAAVGIFVGGFLGLVIVFFRRLGAQLRRQS